MKYREPELKNALIKLDKLLKKYPDDSGEIMAYKQFLKEFIRIQTRELTLPTSEVMAVIKYEKPETYYHLKKTSEDDTIFHFLTNINMNYEKAKENLTEIKNHIV